MKNAIILHGISSNPDHFWFPYVKLELEKRGYEVWVPQLPQPDAPKIEIQLPFILEYGKFSKDTVLIGHSSGASLILSILENLPTQIHQAILVSGFLLRGGQRPATIVKDENEYDWNKMKSNAKNIIIMNSDNDPWGCDDMQGRKMFDHLGGTQMIRHGEGHMGSDLYNQPYKEFPLLIKLVEAFE